MGCVTPSLTRRIVPPPSDNEHPAGISRRAGHVPGLGERLAAEGSELNALGGRLRGHCEKRDRRGQTANSLHFPFLLWTSRSKPSSPRWDRVTLSACSAACQAARAALSSGSPNRQSTGNSGRNSLWSDLSPWPHPVGLQHWWPNREPEWRCRATRRDRRQAAQPPLSRCPSPNGRSAYTVPSNGPSVEQVIDPWYRSHRCR